MKRIFILGILCVSSLVFSQVGIQTDDPQATLDVVGNPSDDTVLDGIIAPRLSLTELASKTYTTTQTGAIVFVDDATGTANTQTQNVTAIGYYFFDGADWEPFDTTNNVWVNNPTDARVELPKLSDGTTDRVASTSLFYVRDDGKLIFGDPLSTGLNGEADNSGFVNIRRTSGTANLKLSSNDGSSIMFLEAFGTGEPGIRFFRGRGTDSDDFSTQLSVQDGDVLANEQFWGYNNSMRPAEKMAFSAARRVVVDGTVVDNDNDGIPTKFTWRTSTNSTGPFIDNMVLDSEGRLGVGEQDPSQRLDVVGQMQLADVAANNANTIISNRDIELASGENNLIYINHSDADNQINPLNLGNSNTILGTRMLRANSSVLGSSNVALGHNINAGSWGNNVVGIGEKIGNQGTVGNSSVLIGNTVGEQATLGSNSIAFGFEAAEVAVWNDNNIGIGTSAGERSDWNEGNIVIGRNAGFRSDYNNSNIVIGEGAGNSGISTASTVMSNNNVVIGLNSVSSNPTEVSDIGSNNIVLTVQDTNIPNRNAVDLGDNNLLLGSKASSDNAAKYNGSTAIGYLAQITQSNQMVLGGTSQDRIDMNAISGVFINGDQVIPDYVFQNYYGAAESLKPEYQMMDLQEVEAFVKENHHLPGVDSAAKISEEGLNISTMIPSQLEKIEELYLHTIEQEKELERLKQENQELKNRLTAIEKALGL